MPTGNMLKASLFGHTAVLPMVSALKWFHYMSEKTAIYNAMLKTILCNGSMSLSALSPTGILPHEMCKQLSCNDGKIDLF